MTNHPNRSCKMQRRHFVAIAKIIAELPESYREAVAWKFAQRLGLANPRFLPGKFLDACQYVAKLPRATVPVSQVHSGTVLACDDSFTCLKTGARRKVRKGEDGELYILCSAGRHYLDGQLDESGKNYIGFSLA